MGSFSIGYYATDKTVTANGLKFATIQLAMLF